MGSHRDRGARADNALARFDSSNGNMAVPPIVRSESARLVPLGRVVMTYQFIKVAECLLGTRRSISFVVISYRRDHLQLSSAMQSPFMPCLYDVVSSSSHSPAVTSKKPPRTHRATSEPQRRATNPTVTRDCTVVMGQDLAMRTARGSYTHWSWYEGGEIEGRRRDGARVVVLPPWSCLRFGDRIPHKDVSRAAMVYSYVQWHEDQ